MKAILSTISIAIVIFVVSFLFYFLPLDRPFVTRGEGREALVVQAMLETENYVLPLRGGTDIPSKPPMFHWLAVVGGKLGLVDGIEQSIRFPSPFLASLLLASTFVFLSRFGNYSGLSERLATSLASVLITALSFEFFINTTHARVDMCFAFWIFISLFWLFAVAEDYRNGKQPALWKYVLCGMVLSGAILSKGPTGLLIPLMIVGAYVFLVDKPFYYGGASDTAKNFSIKRILGRLLATIKSLPYQYVTLTVVISLLIAGTWYYLGYLEQGNDFLYKLI